MKTLNKMPVAFLIAVYFLVKITGRLLHSFKDTPEPDFNNGHDPTMP